MNKQEAEEYAKEMTYRDAVYNALQGRCIPYRKATLIKLHELLDMVEGKVVYSDTDSIKMRSLTIKEKEKFRTLLNKTFGTAAIEPCIDENLISIQRLNKIRNYIVINIMRNPDIMFSDIRDNDVDPIEVIASLYEILHRIITGEPYRYMFHWANKCGSWVEDDLFTRENPENRS